MAGDPRVPGLLVDMLDAGRTPEEVCQNCPELLPEVRERWREFQLIDAAVVELLPGLVTRPSADTIMHVPAPGDLPHIPGYEILGICGHGGMGVVYRARQLGAKRLVALKMIRAVEHANPTDRLRFQIETE